MSGVRLIVDIGLIMGVRFICLRMYTGLMSGVVFNGYDVNRWGYV